MLDLTVRRQVVWALGEELKIGPPSTDSYQC